MKKANMTFKKVFIIYLGILLAVGLGFLGIVYSILSEYEKAQASHLIEERLGLLTEAVAADDTLMLSTLSPATVSRFEKSPRQLYQSICESLKGKTYTYALSSESFDSAAPEYIICADQTPIGTVQLKLLSEKTKLGFLSVPNWEITDITIDSSSFFASYSVVVPRDFTVTVNGIAETDVDGSPIPEHEDFIRYKVPGLTEKPEIIAVDRFGNTAECEFTELPVQGNSDVPMIQVQVTANQFLASLPSDFNVLLNHEPLSGTQKENFKDYSLYSAKEITIDYINSVLSISDSLGNPVSFREIDGVITPVYQDYRITVPSVYSVSINSLPLEAEAVIDSQPLTTEQYNPTITTMNTYRLYLAFAPQVSVTDAEGNPVSLQTEGTRYFTPLVDYKITIPDNFTLQINRMDPKTDDIKTSANPEYQYITDYTVVPSLLTYTFPGLAVPPVYTITDNIGERMEYQANDDFTVTSQTGLDTLPDTIPEAPDVMEIAKTWNLFMTDDLGGELSGYYKVRSYLIKDSYYDKAAYNWATGIDITFISDHVFRTPAFTEESVTNFVVYSNTCFSCDVHFNKHMTLTRTGKQQDDTFHRRMFLVYHDDSDDGVDNPHWVIADMQDI